MRDVEHIWNAWTDTGPKTEDYKPVSRVTVEQSFYLRPSGTEDQVSVVVGTWTRGPARWYQRYDRTKQIETEIPNENIRTVSLERSIESDAGNCTISLINTRNLRFGEPEETTGQFGRSGYFTWSRGASQEAIARWGHARNEWWNVLVPNALLRTYQGYGGEDKTIAQAVEDGNLVLTGVWLVDEIRVLTNGTLEVKSRDPGKLLIDQQLFPPLVPMQQYPLRYFRYTWLDFPIPPDVAPGPIHEIINQSTGSVDGLGDYVDGPLTVA